MSVLKAITARRPCRKIPKESIKAPFSHPRLLGSGVGVEDTDVLVRDTAGIPAPPGPASATSPCWDSMLTPLAAAMGQKIWTWLINKVKKSSSSRSDPVLLRSCRSANRYAKQDSLRWKMVTSSPLKARTHSPASGIHSFFVTGQVKPSALEVATTYSVVPTEPCTQFKTAMQHLKKKKLV